MTMKTQTRMKEVPKERGLTLEQRTPNLRFHSQIVKIYRQYHCMKGYVKMMSILKEGGWEGLCVRTTLTSSLQGSFVVRQAYGYVSRKST
jgi:hypothetical protein